jgi:hypothetical protein
MSMNKHLRNIVADVFLLAALPVSVYVINLSFYFSCCSEYPTSYGRYNFLDGILPKHDVQLSFSIVVFLCILIAYLICFGIASAIRKDKKYFLNALISLVHLLPLFAVWHLSYWFKFEYRNTWLFEYPLLLIGIPTLWLGGVWISKKLVAKVSDSRLTGLSFKALLFVYLAIVIGSVDFVGLLIVCPAVFCALIFTIARRYRELTKERE